MCLCVCLSDHMFMFILSVPGKPQAGPTIKSAGLGPVFTPNEGQTQAIAGLYQTSDRTTISLQTKVFKNVLPFILFSEY